MNLYFRVVGIKFWLFLGCYCLVKIWLSMSVVTEVSVRR